MRILATVALLLYGLYAIAAAREGLSTPRGSGGLRTLNFAAGLAIITALLYATWVDG